MRLRGVRKLTARERRPLPLLRLTRPTRAQGQGAAAPHEALRAVDASGAREFRRPRSLAAGRQATEERDGPSATTGGEIVITTRDLRPCPFCDSDDVRLVVDDCRSCAAGIYAKCWCCEARGPDRDTKTEAADAWDARAGDVKPEPGEVARNLVGLLPDDSTCEDW